MAVFARAALCPARAGRLVPSPHLEMETGRGGGIAAPCPRLS